jgi:hypothetical protein
MKSKEIIEMKWDGKRNKTKEKKKWYFVTKIVLTYSSSDREQFIQTVKGQNNFW